MVADELAMLPAHKQSYFWAEYKRKDRSLLFGYLLFFFFGLHYAYVGKWGYQALYWITAGGAHHSADGGRAFRGSGGRFHDLPVTGLPIGGAEVGATAEDNRCEGGDQSSATEDVGDELTGRRIEVSHDGSERHGQKEDRRAWRNRLASR